MFAISAVRCAARSSFVHLLCGQMLLLGAAAIWCESPKVLGVGGDAAMAVMAVERRRQSRLPCLNLRLRRPSAPSLRTSLATTAKPLPCAPARAASIFASAPAPGLGSDGIDQVSHFGHAAAGGLQLRIEFCFPR